MGNSLPPVKPAKRAMAEPYRPPTAAGMAEDAKVNAPHRAQRSLVDAYNRRESMKKQPAAGKKQTIASRLISGFRTMRGR